MQADNRINSATQISGMLSSQTINKFIGKNYLLISLILLIIIGTVTNSAFLSKANIKGLLVTTAIYGLVAIGQSLVMLVSELNLTLGSSMAFSPILALWLTKKIFAGSDRVIVKNGIQVVDGLWYIILFTIIISIIVGLIIGLIRVNSGVSSLIISLGMTYVLQGASYIISGSNLAYLSDIKNVNWLGTAAIGPFPVCFLLFLLVGLTFIFLMRYTRFGLRLYATGGNEKAAVYSGIKTKFWKALALAISGLCSGLAAIVYSSRMESIDPIQGDGLQFYALSTAIIGGFSIGGGKGSLSGTLIASLILVIALNLMQIAGIASWYQTIILGVIILAASVQTSRKPKA